tara:strand:+ start:50 stop:394 length:345 start_codon:yes stop_codon:yes gene_type:complete
MALKQVIIVRKDLKMNSSKMSSQVAHASVDTVLKSSKEKVEKWRKEGMKKVVLKVEDEKELVEMYKLAKKKKLVCVLIKDAGRTFFKKATKTCVGIGPDLESKIDEVSGKLKML